MKLAVSNIAWTAADDACMHAMLQDRGIDGLEIAPTRIIPDAPYEHISKAKAWSAALFEQHRLTVASIQSIWRGRDERVFGTDEERAALLDYTRKAVLFAQAIGARNLVFGCPGNRVRGDRDESLAVAFLRKAGDFAAGHGCTIALEANPPIYHTDWMNGTADAFRVCREVASPGVRVNLDLGTMVENGENPDCIDLSLVSHVHLSEPGLAPIQPRRLHQDFADMLRSAGYDRWVSLEMGSGAGTDEVLRSIDYLTGVFA